MSLTPAQLKKAGDLTGAIAQLQAMLAAGEDCVFQLAKYLQTAGRYPEAIELLDKTKAGAQDFASLQVADRQNDPDEAAAFIFARRNVEIAKAGLLIAQRERDQARSAAYEKDLADWSEEAEVSYDVLRAKSKRRLAVHNRQAQRRRENAIQRGQERMQERKQWWTRRAVFALLVLAVVASAAFGN